MTAKNTQALKRKTNKKNKQQRIRRIKNDPQCASTEFQSLHEICGRKDEEKIHINTTCMCITYRISFFCGLTNPSEKKRINDNQCAHYVSTKPPTLEVSPCSKPILQVCCQGLTQSPNRQHLNYALQLRFSSKAK